MYATPLPCLPTFAIIFLLILTHLQTTDLKKGHVSLNYMLKLSRFLVPCVGPWIRVNFLTQTVKRPVQTGNVWRPNTIKHCLVTKHFTVWPPCLTLFDRVWSCLIKFEGHQTFDQTTSNISFVLVFDGRCFVRLDSLIKHVWCAHAYHACSATCTYLCI